MNAKGRPDINKNVQKARWAAYSLLSTGVHGRNGLDPPTSFRIIQLYVIPRLLQGLEATCLLRSDIQALDTFYKKLLRQIQGLPESVATDAIYLLIGSLPIETVLHQRILSLFGNICRLDSNEPMHQMALRQLATADDKLYSWFSQLNTIAQKYQIDLHLALVHPWPKEAWKRYCKNTVRDIWWNELLTKACEKTTLRWTIWQDQQCTNGLWSSCKGRPNLTNAATTRARMLVDHSDLRASAWRRAAGEDLRCPLCRDHEEDIVHFLTLCPELSNTRGERLLAIKSIYTKENLPELITPQETTCAILNGDRFIQESSLEWGSQPMATVTLTKNAEKAQQLCSQLCYKLKTERDIAMNCKIMMD